MNISVSDYSFRQYMAATGATRFDICDIAVRLGYTGMEFINLDYPAFSKAGEDTGELARRLRAHCEERGLPVVAYAFSGNYLSGNPGEVLEKHKRHIELASLLGTTLVRQDTGYALPAHPGYSWREAMRDVVPYIREVCDIAAERGIIVTIENHGNVFQDGYRVEELIRAVGRENYGWLFDLGNMESAGDSADIVLSRYALPYLRHVHVKDNLKKPGDVIAPEGFSLSRRGEYKRATVLGHGETPIVAVVNQLKRSGYAGWYTVEFEGPEENLYALEKGRAYLARLLA